MKKKRKYILNILEAYTKNNAAEIFEFGSFQQFRKLSEKLQWSKNKLYNTLG